MLNASGRGLLEVLQRLRTIMCRARASLSALVVALALPALAASAADGLYLDLPHDPIGPTSKAECDELYARYQGVWDRLRLEARAESDKAWSVATDGRYLGPGGAGERSRPHYRRASEIRERASDILSRGIRARNRCMTQVRNHLRQERREQARIRVAAPGGQPDGSLARTGEALGGVPGHAGYQVLRGAGLAGLRALGRSGRRYTVGGRTYGLPANRHFARVAETLFRITEVGSVVLGNRSSDGSTSLSAGAALGLEAVDRLSRWNALQKVLFRASVGLLLNIQSAASADLAAAFAAFDRSVGLQDLERRLANYSRAEAARYQAALRGIPAAPADTLAADLDRYVPQIVAMRNQRGVPAAQQLAEAERRRRAAEAERQRREAAQARRRAEEAERRWLEEEEEWERELESRAERRRRQPNAWDMFNDLVNQGARETHERWMREQRSSGQGGLRASGCERIGERLARDLEMLAGSDSMCTIHRGTANALGRARNSLASTGCASRSELADMDRAIRQAEAGARAAC